MKQIELSQNRVAIVNDDDFKWLSKWNWSFLKGRTTGYAVRTIQQSKQQKMLLMHVEILRYSGHQSIKSVDHINGCGCDNRRKNLRIATPCQNGGNMKKRSSNTSGIIGVSWSQSHRQWYAQIRVNYKTQSLGYYTHIKDAIAARRRAEIKYFGEYRHDPKKLCPLWKTGQCPDCAKRAKDLGLTKR